jgi:nicotinate phosphoribosyltransferase
MPSLNIQPEDYGLLTDLYQLTMSASYLGEGLDTQIASFELFVRRLPENYGYLIAMGLEQVLDYLEQLSFGSEQLQALRDTGIFAQAPAQFWDTLAVGKFTGEVWAVPEGTAVFAQEPILRVEAPLWQAQLAETYLLNTINYQTLIATKAARMRDMAGPEAKLFEFGTRRAFSPQGALWAARAALAAGMDGTSNVLAAVRLGEKPVGTIAHALIMAFKAQNGSEMAAFEAFHRYFPGAPLLIDTYDPIAAARMLAEYPQPLGGVRIDSGDLAELAGQIQSILPEIPIFASGDLDEWAIAKLSQTPIQGYGIGTKLVTGTPVNGVYKLVEINGTPVMKESSGKTTYPGRKQIFRHSRRGQISHDVLELVDCPSDGQPLLELAMHQGSRCQPPASLNEIRQRTAMSLASLDPAIRHLNSDRSLSVMIGQNLQELTARIATTKQG